MTDAFNLVGAVELRQEGAQRILAGHLVARLLNKVKPFSVVDFLDWLRPGPQDANCDSFQTLAAQTLIEVVDPHLSRLAKRPLKLLKCMAVFCGAPLDFLGERPEPPGLLSLSLDPGGERRGLLD